MPAILHADVDGFFIQVHACNFPEWLQVEQQRQPHLQGRAVALQQHADIIAVNAEAKAAGVKKHMAPGSARSLLKAVHGVVAYVHVEEGGRISYRPYREASAKFFAMLATLQLAAVVEKGSIDEAFILCNGGCGCAAGSAADMHGSGVSPTGSFLDESSLQVAQALAATVRQRALGELGMRVSVGVAGNKLLAKLASAAAKPDGVHVVASASAAAELLRKVPVSRMPGFGGKVAQALAAHSIHSAQQVSTMTVPALRALCSTLTEQAAQKLLDYSRGIDPSVPQVRQPPKALTLQMSLTPVPTALPPAARGAEPSGGGEKDGMLHPLFMHAADAPARMQSLISVMAGDLLGRVWHDGEVQGRWPTAVTLKLRTHGAAGQLLSRSDRFPPWADLSPWALCGRAPPPPTPTAAGADAAEGGRAAPSTPPASQQQPAAQLQGSGADAEPAKDPGGILGAVVKAAMGMFGDMRRAHAADLPVVEVHIGAGKFKSVDSARMMPLTRLFGAGHEPVPGNQSTSAGAPEDAMRVSTPPDPAAVPSRGGSGLVSERASAAAADVAMIAGDQQPSRSALKRPGPDASGGTVVGDASMACTEAPARAGFGSPIAGLVGIKDDREQSMGTLRRHRPRHSVRQADLGASGTGFGADVRLQHPHTSAHEQTAAVHEAFCGANDVVWPHSSSVHARRNGHDRANNAESRREQRHVTLFDPSASDREQTLTAAHNPPAIDSAYDELDRAKTSSVSDVMVVDFVELMGAWHHRELDGDDLQMVADSILRGVRRA